MDKTPPMTKDGADDYQTPPDALLPLYEYLAKDKIIWEPACGYGNLVKAFEERGYEVVATDKYVPPLPLRDFLIYEPKVYDCIITNPPFSIKTEFVRRCYALGKPFALLMPYAGLETDDRQKIYKKYGLELIFFNQRINFEVPSGTKNSGSKFPVAWFTRGLGLPLQLNFVDLREYKNQKLDLR